MGIHRRAADGADTLARREAGRWRSGRTSAAPEAGSTLPAGQRDRGITSPFLASTRNTCHRSASPSMKSRAQRLGCSQDAGAAGPSTRERNG